MAAARASRANNQRDRQPDTQQSSRAQPALLGLGAGALGGGIGTVTMSLGMLAARRLGLMGRQPPEKITSGVLAKIGVHVSRQTKDRLAVLLHFGFGIAGGMPFGLFARRIPLDTRLAGVLYATGIWTVSYLGWAPALGLMPPAQRDRKDRPAVMVLVHWVYGATLGAIVGQLAPNS